MTVPTNPKDLKSIKASIKEISEAMTMISDRRSSITDIKKDLRDGYELEPKTISIMVKAYHNQNLAELQEQLDDAEAVLNA